MQDYLAFQADFNSPDTVSTYDELPLWSAMFGLVLLRHIPLRQHGTVLDLGCGTGFPLLELAQRLGPTCTIYGIDPWERALDRAAHKAEAWGVENIHLRLGTAEDLPFPDGFFDLIVSNLGINNFNSPEAALAECWRVARPSAQIVLTTNLKGHMSEFYAVFESTLLELGKQPLLDALRLHIDHRTTLESMTRLLEGSGFHITRVHEESAQMRFADGSAFLRHYFIKLGFLGAWKELVDSRDYETVFAQLETNLNRAAEKQGEFVLTIPIAYIEAEKVA